MIPPGFNHSFWCKFIEWRSSLHVIQVKLRGLIYGVVSSRPRITWIWAVVRHRLRYMGKVTRGTTALWVVTGPSTLASLQTFRCHVKAGCRIWLLVCGPRFGLGTTGNSGLAEKLVLRIHTTFCRACCSLHQSLKRGLLHVCTHIQWFFSSRCIVLYQSP